MNNGPFISYIKDGKGRFAFYNDPLAQRFGVSPETWLGKSDADLFPPEIAAVYRNNDLEVLAGDTVHVLSETLAEPHGCVSHWTSYKFPFRQSDGELMLAGVSIDVTAEIEGKAQLKRSLEEKEELARSLESSRRLFHTFADFSPNLSFMKSEDGRYLFYNRLFAELFNIDQSAWIGKSDRDVLPAAVAEVFEKTDRRVLESGEKLESIDRMPNPAGELRTFKTVKFTYQGADGHRMIAGVSVDVTDEINRERELTEANQRLDLLAATDSLTGIPNRRAFESRIAIDFANSLRSSRPISMLLLDIDNFKRRNDELGHAAGDAALQVLGRVLRESSRKGDLPARLGGEEFAVLLPDTDSAGAVAMARRIQASLKAETAGLRELTVSIGVACDSPTTHSWKLLIARADDAMYEAKRSGKNCVILHQEHVARLMMEMAAAEPATPSPTRPARPKAAAGIQPPAPAARYKQRRRPVKPRSRR